MNDDDETFESMLLLNQQISSPYINNTHSMLMNIKNKAINEQTRSTYQSPRSRPHTPIRANNTSHTVKTPLLQKQLNDNESIAYSSSSEEDSLEDKMKVVFDKVINRKKNIINKEKVVQETISNKESNCNKAKKKKKKEKKKKEEDKKMIKNKEISYQREKRYLLDKIEKLTKENKELKKEIDKELSKRKDYIQIVEEIVNIYNKVKITLLILLVLVNTVYNYLMIKQSLHNEKIYLYLDIQKKLIFPFSSTSNSNSPYRLFTFHFNTIIHCIISH